MNRTELRQHLLQQRQASGPTQRLAWDARIIESLRGCLLTHSARSIGAYWPIRSEPDLRPLLRELDQRGYVIALPEVIGPAQPLRFLRWQPDQTMVSGSHGIPVPTGASIQPDLLLVPCVGFWLDAKGQRYRLGYGGGYYDRTLAACPVPALGIAYECGRIDGAGFHPDTHDVPLDRVITERGIF